MILADEGVAILQLIVGGFTLNPTLIWDEDMAILIDTGMPEQNSQISKEIIEKVGIPLERLRSVILTHQDIDHIGSLPALMNDCDNNLMVYAHKQDKPYIEGQKPLLKLELPKELQHWIHNPPAIKVDELLNDGDELPFFGGVRVIFTPGHTPGHISLYLNKSKILVAGDALFCLDGHLQAPTSHTTPDLSNAQKSIKKFLDYDISKVICFHGGLCTERVNEQIARVVQSMES